MKILIAHQIPRSPFVNMPADWTITFPEEDKIRFSTEELVELIPTYEAFVSFFTDPVPNAVIDAAKKLKIISNFGAGYNNIDVAYARSKNIAVTNTPKSVCNPTAEHAMALMLAVSRRIGEMNIKIRLQKEALWKTNLLGHTLEGKTLGIIGMGRIGQNLAKKAEAFGMRIIYCNRFTDVPGYKRVSMETLLSEADVVSVHVPLTSENTKLIGAGELQTMKASAYLINTSRGAVIDEEALAVALETGQIAGAGLDVFENEPTVNEKLYKLSNVVLVPHLGTATVETREGTSSEALSNIINFFAGSPTNVVN
ncbi:MAG: dihydrofolate reductase [Bacteroidales bacterium]|nr:dihydrofolate reductase [Bacteroidales bacterium]MDE7072904.1 dihydrofolate reductase [Bacteroidales bacterium]